MGLRSPSLSEAVAVDFHLLLWIIFADDVLRLTEFHLRGRQQPKFVSMLSADCTTTTVQTWLTLARLRGYDERESVPDQAVGY